MKLYCAECFEEISNCAPWCAERQREDTLRMCRSADALGLIHTTNCRCAACAPRVKGEKATA